jgi:hypothetical protein
VSLLIGLPTTGKPTEAFLGGLKAARWPESLGRVERIVVTGNFVPGQRELIVRRALASEADLLLMIDDDIVVPPAGVSELYETLALHPRTAIAGGLYYSRDGKRPMAVAQWRASETTDAIVPAFTGKGSVEVDGVGFGCVLLRTAALRALSPPYFGVQIAVDTARNTVRLCNEDYLLCERLRHAGFTIRLDARVRCGHFDRDQAILLPQEWEPEEATGSPRMYIRQPDGVEALVPFVDGGPHAVETHEYGKLDYLFM